MDYLILGVTQAGPPKVMARIHLADDGCVTFDESYGDADFVARLKQDGISSIFEADNACVKPEDGKNFIEALLQMFASYPIWMGEEEELNRLNAEYADVAKVA